MKHALFIIIVIIPFFSCSQKRDNSKTSKTTSSSVNTSSLVKENNSDRIYPEVEQRSVIIGNIENFKRFTKESRTVKLFVDDISIGQQLLFVTEINDSGKFVFDIPLYHSTNTYLKYCDGRITPYLFPNDTLRLNCELSNVGELIDINMISCDEKHDKFQKEFTNQEYWISKQILNFEQNLPKDLTIYEMKNKCFAFEKSLHEKIDIRIGDKASNQVLYDYLRFTATYKSYNDILILGKDIKDTDERKMFYSFLTDSIVFNKDALITSIFRVFLNNYGAFVEPKLEITYISFNETKDQRTLGIITKEIDKKMEARKGTWAEYLVSSVIYNKVIKKEEEFSVSEIENYIQISQEKISDKYIQQLLLSMLFKQQKSIAERNNISLPDGANLKAADKITSGGQILSEIITKNKGKVIYIDIWATWCSACLQLFPDAKRLHEMFDENDVSFVYLCCRSQNEASQNVIKKYQLKGSHYFLDRTQYEYFEKKFLIAGIPRFILIDKSGKMVSSNALNPNSKGIISEINRLINK
jgi:thiol-disulfide isomerase/thioredoxin